jgi:hypothetical protein
VTPAPAYRTDPRVDAYIDALPAWQQAVCRQVRDLVHAADPEVEETVKRTVQPYFVLRGNVCALLAARDHVNVFLYDGAIVPDPHGIITAGHGNQTARTVAVREGEPLNAPALLEMLRQIIADNRVGGWRVLKRAAERSVAQGSPVTGEGSVESGAIVRMAPRPRDHGRRDSTPREEEQG